jgi:serine/threonine protein phosphatase PrpC
MMGEDVSVGGEQSDQNEVEITAELEPAKLEQEWEELVERARRVHATIRFAARTDLGRVRENNEDKFDFFEPDDPETIASKGSFYGVADGMGGHAAGQIASELALKTVIKSYYADRSIDVIGCLRRAVFEANLLIYESAQAIADRWGMGTTLSAVVIRADEAYFAQVGDSRGYLVRDGRARQVTEDHSWVAEQIKRGALTEEEAEYSAFRNVITRALGSQASVEPDIFVEKLEKGDVILLCSDGLTGNVSADEIGRIVSRSGPSRAAMELVDLANDRGGNDNITVVILAVTDICGETEEMQKEQTRRKLFGLFR